MYYIVVTMLIQQRGGSDSEQSCLNRSQFLLLETCLWFGSGLEIESNMCRAVFMMTTLNLMFQSLLLVTSDPSQRDLFTDGCVYMILIMFTLHLGRSYERESFYTNEYN